MIDLVGIEIAVKKCSLRITPSIICWLWIFNIAQNKMVIIAVSLAVGLGLNLVPSAVQYLPGIIKTLATSAVAPTAIIAVLLNLILPEEL